MLFYRIMTTGRTALIPVDKCWISRQRNEIQIHVLGSVGGPLSAKPGDISLFDDVDLHGAVAELNKI